MAAQIDRMPAARSHPVSKRNDQQGAGGPAGAQARGAPVTTPAAATPAHGEAPPPPLHGVALAVVAVALSLGTFMQVLDGTIANVSLPTIVGNLGESTDKGTWVITAFAVANGVTVPLTGWLMRRFGIVTTFIGSVTLFTLASLLCGMAWNLTSLIVFRLLQGAVSGPLIPGSQALLIAVYPPEKRAVALAIWSVTVLVGPVAGPLLGGYISDHFHWGWIFLINVPVGILTVLMLAPRMRPYNTPPVKLPIDMVGLVLLVVWVGALQLMLDLGKNADWFSSPMIIALAVVAAVACVAWVIWEVAEKVPMVDLSLLRRRNFAIATLVFCSGYALFFANTLLLPLWLQQEQGYTASWAGMVMAPAGLMAILMAPPLTHLASKIDVRWLASLAFAAFGSSFLLRAGFTTGVDFTHLILPMLVQGLGMAIFFTALTTISLDGIEPQRIPSATGLISFLRITAGGFAASITTTLWDRREAMHQSRLVEQTVAGNPAFVSATGRLGAQGLGLPGASSAILRQVVAEAYLLATTDLFWMSGWICLAMIGLIWLTRRPSVPKGPVAAD